MAESIKKINTEIEKIENYNQALSYNVNKHSKKLEIIEKNITFINNISKGIIRLNNDINDLKKIVKLKQLIKNNIINEISIKQKKEIKDIVTDKFE